MAKAGPSTDLSDPWVSHQKAMEIIIANLREKSAASKEAADGVGENPFLAMAQKEADDNELIGSENHGDKWIKNRAEQLWEEAKERGDDAASDRYFPLSKLEVVFNNALNARYGDDVKKLAESVVEDEIRSRKVDVSSAIAEDRRTRPIEDTVQERIDRQVNEIKEGLEKKSRDSRFEDTKATIIVLQSMLLAGSIPSFNMLPGLWKGLVFLPIAAIVYLNWKPFMRMQEKMKNLKQEIIEAQRVSKIL